MKFSKNIFKNLLIPLGVLFLSLAALYLYQRSPFVYNEFVRICSFSTSKKAGYDLCFKPYWDQVTWLTFFLKIVGGALVVDFLLSRFSKDR